ncbi:MAG: phosphatase PAP2 family protein [Oscillospiraceae bacterium]|nr:phosphatase PAP2 family protein [Oscillospiraceae bacterium]
MSIISSVQKIDKNAIRYVTRRLRGERIEDVMSTLTRLGDLGLAWLLPAAYMLSKYKYRRRGAELLVCFGLCAAINNLVLKNIVDRERPYEAMPWLDTLIKRPRDYSFPSGHAAGAFASAYAIAKGFGKKLGIPAYALASAIALTRVGVGVHYPSDVVTGAAVGTIIGAGAMKGMRKLGDSTR